SPNVRVNSYALVESSILFDGVDVGRHCKIRKAIIDKDVKIPPHTTIGHDPEHDRQRGFLVTEQGVVVIAKAELPETFAPKGEGRLMDSPRPNRGWIWFFVILIVLTVTSITIMIVYNLRQQLKPEQLAQARALWEQKGPADYDLDYTQVGSASGTF